MISEPPAKSLQHSWLRFLGAPIALEYLTDLLYSVKAFWGGQDTVSEQWQASSLGCHEIMDIHWCFSVKL